MTNPITFKAVLWDGEHRLCEGVLAVTLYGPMPEAQDGADEDPLPLRRSIAYECAFRLDDDTAQTQLPTNLAAIQPLRLVLPEIRRSYGCVFRVRDLTDGSWGLSLTGEVPYIDELKRS